MALAPFPFIIDGVRGDVPINFYAVQDSERKVLLEGTPGLETLCTLPDCSEVRAIANPYNTYLYALARRGSQSILFRVDSAGGYAELGTLTTSFAGPAWFINNDSQIGICDGQTINVYSPAGGGLVQVSDLDFPGASSLDYQDGYGLFTIPGTNQWGFSALFDLLNYDALDFYTKMTISDRVVALRSKNREPWVFGQKSTEVWYNAGGDNSSANSPTFALNTGGVIAHGIAGAGANCVVDNYMAWLSEKNQVLLGSGYTAKSIGSAMLGRAVRQFSAHDDTLFFSYTDEETNTTFLVVTFPTGDQTWVYDMKTQLWHKRQSRKADGTFGRWRANCYALMNKVHYIGEYTNGKIYKMSSEYYDDAGEPIRREAITQEIDGGMQHLTYPPISLVLESGVGVPQGVDPQVMLQISGDGGHTWSSEIWRSAGKVGEYGSRGAIWHQMGSGFRRMYKFVMTDAVLWRILGISYGQEMMEKRQNGVS